MFEYEEMFLEAEDSLFDSEEVSTEESYIDPEDEMSIIEAMVDMEIAEACKKEGCGKGKGSKDGVCEKCGKPVKQCECGK